MNVGIYIYDEAEVLDFSGPFEVFSTAKRLGLQDWNVYLLSESTNPVSARGGYKVLPHYSIAEHPEIDVVVIPGGVHLSEMNKSTLLDWLRYVDKRTKLTVSVCKGSFILANAGVFRNISVTTHNEDIHDLKARFPHLDVVQGRRWVQSGKYISSGGISAGIDVSLWIVAQLHTLDFAERVAQKMEYYWQKKAVE